MQTIGSALWFEASTKKVESQNRPVPEGYWLRVESRRHLVYDLKGRDNAKMIIALHVDDFLLTSSEVPAISWMVTELTKRFEMKDFGEARLRLGLGIARSRPRRALAITITVCNLCFGTFWHGKLPTCEHTDGSLQTIAEKSNDSTDEIELPS